MKGILLAGGYGSRLRPLTYICNKHLLPVYDKPMIEYGLEALRDAGIRDICVILGGAKPEQVMNYLGDGFRYGLNLSYKWQGEPKGIAHAILCAKDFIADDEKFVAYLADNIFENGISEFVRDFEASNCDTYIWLKKVKCPERYGVAEIKDGMIVSVEEKPKQPKSDLIFVGVYGFRPNIFDVIKKLKPSWRKEYEISDAVNYMVVNKEFTVKYSILKYKWFDAGSFDSILDAALFRRERMRGR